MSDIISDNTPPRHRSNKLVGGITSELIMTDARDIVERLHLAATDAIHDDAKADILEAIQTIANLEAENFVLSAGSCDVEGGKIGDEHGHFYCTLQVELASLRKQLSDAREALRDIARPRHGHQALAEDGKEQPKHLYPYYAGVFSQLQQKAREALKCQP